MRGAAHHVSMPRHRQRRMPRPCDGCPRPSAHLRVPRSRGSVSRRSTGIDSDALAPTVGTPASRLRTGRASSRRPHRWPIPLLRRDRCTRRRSDLSTARLARRSSGRDRQGSCRFLALHRATKARVLQPQLSGKARLSLSPRMWLRVGARGESSSDQCARYQEKCKHP